MYQRDTILKMIEQAAGYIYRSGIMRQNRQLQEALELLNQAIRQLLGLNSKLLQGLSAVEVLKLLSKNGTADVGKSLVLGELMQAQAAVLQDAGEQEAARQLLLKSAEILLSVRASDEGAGYREELDPRIDALLDQAGKAPRKAELLQLEWAYYIEGERFGRAEDTLFFLLGELEKEGRHVERNAMLEEGIRIYEGWLGLPAEKLESGNLSADEVRQSLAELKDLKSNFSRNP